jgi:polysaccharide biosynthesis protein PslF
MRVLFISSYVPRKCGIATFCRDLVNGLISADHSISVDVAAMVDDLTNPLSFPDEVAFALREKSWEDYQSLAQKINQTGSYDLIFIQHEYGIYGGVAGEFIARFLEGLNKPVITTLHTILPNPSKHQKEVLQRVCKNSQMLVVMLKGGANILTEVYGVPPYKIKIVPHGTPKFAPDFRKKKDNIVMSSINLLSSVKGLEFSIAALPKIVEKFPNFIYQVIGETHPNVIKWYKGEDLLRGRLEKLVKKLGVEKNVKFINEYVSVADLVKYISESDFYVTPYLDPQQSSSGALAYAIGAGKVCVSTPYLYAKEMLSHDAGFLVPFRDSQAISQAVLKVILDPDLKKRLEFNAYKIGKTMSWEKIGNDYFALMKEVLLLVHPHALLSLSKRAESL